MAFRPTPAEPGRCDGPRAGDGWRAPIRSGLHALALLGRQDVLLPLPGEVVLAIVVRLEVGVVAVLVNELVVDVVLQVFA